MCAPAAIAMAGIGIASSAAQYAAQSTYANAQANYQNQMYARTAQSSIANFDQESAWAGVRQQQNAASAGQQTFANDLQAAGAAGHAQAAAADAGVSGNSVNELYNEFDRIAGMNNATVSENLNYQQQQVGQEVRGMQSQAQSRINAATPGPVQYPSLAGSLLQGATSVFSAYNANAMWNKTGPYSPSNVPDTGWWFKDPFANSSRVTSG